MFLKFKCLFLILIFSLLLNEANSLQLRNFRKPMPNSQVPLNLNRSKIFGNDVKSNLSIPSLNLVVVGISAVLATIAAVPLPLLNGQIIRKILRPDLKIFEVYRTLGCMFLCYIFEPLFTILYARKCASLINIVLVNFQKHVYKVLLAQNIPYFDNNRAEVLTSLATTEIDTIRSLCNGNLSRDRGIRGIMEIIFALVLLFWQCPPLALLIGFLIPISSTLSFRFGRRFQVLSGQELVQKANLLSSTQEAVANFREVFTFRTQRVEEDRFNALQQNVSSAALGTSFARANFEAMNRIGIYSTIGTSLAVGVWMVAKRIIAPHVLVASTYYSFTLNFAMQGLLYSYTDLQLLQQSLSRINELLLSQSTSPIPTPVSLLPPVADSSTASPTVPTSSQHGYKMKNFKSIQLRAAGFAYPSRPDIAVVKDLTLDIPAGKVTALVGPSGSGKSTIASLLCRFYEPSTGAVLVDDVDYTSLPLDEYLEDVSIVRQAPAVFSGTIADNIAYGAVGLRNVTFAEIVAAARAGNAHEFILKLPEGYNTLVGNGAGRVQLSGGQRQRIAIARAVLKNASLLVLDEATSALDAESESLVQDALRKLMRGRTTVVIAHRLSTVIDADQICVVRNGQVAEKGSHKELMKRHGYYYALMRTQQNAYIS